MTSLNDFINNKNKQQSSNDPNYTQVEGSFDCQYCRLSSESAIMDSSGNLQWQCPDGHVSMGKL